MASVTLQLASANWSSNHFRMTWQTANDAQMELGTELSVDGATQLYFGYLTLPRRASTITNIGIRLSGAQGDNPNTVGPDFSTEMETDGTVTLTASNGDSVTFGLGDATDPYSFTPSNLGEVNTFANAVQGLTDRDVTAVFDDGQAAAPDTQIQGAIESGAPTLTAQVRTTPPPSRIRGALTSGTPTVAAQVRTTAPVAFGLASFDDTGLDVIVLGLITAGAPVGTTVYRDVVNGGTQIGSLAAGSDLEVQTNQSITRIARNIGSDDIRMWDSPSSLSWNDFFTDNPDVYLRVQFPSSGPYTLTRGGQGANFSSWSAPTTAARTDIDAISEGDEFIIALAQTAPTTTTEAQIQGAIESGAPTVAASVRTTRRVRVQADIESGTPTVAAQVRTTRNIRVQAAIESGAPAVTAQVRTTPPPSRVRGAIESGAPTLTARVRTEAPGEVQVSGDIESGVPTVAARVRATRNIRVQGDIESGTPTVSARVRTEAQGEARIQGAIESGAPTLAAQVRTTPPPSRVRGAVEAGTPTLMARVRTEAPGEAKIQGDIESGVPSVAAQVRQTRSIRIRGTIQSGVPTVDAEVRQTRRIRVRGAVESGVPSVTARIIAAAPQRVRAAIESGVPEVEARVGATILRAKIGADIESGVPIVTAQVRMRLPLGYRIFIADFGDEVVISIDRD